MYPAEDGIAAGTVLVGKYRIESVLGRGGMGMVYRAHHLTLDETIAIKVLRRDVSLDEETVHRFVREAQSAVKLKSEHVARIRDVGTFDDGLPYMVMEFLEGADLGQLVDANGAMNVPVAVDLVLQACDAIAEAHSLGIVHRDIKPTNLFVSFRPDQTAIVKVLDFGISKSSTGADLSLTQTSSMLGTPAYMSPEQMRSARTVDARTDVWSIGTVLYELVEARRPFNAESFSEMCVMVAMDPPAPMVHAPELEPIVLRCLHKNPKDRYANVPELMRDLAQFAGNADAARRFITRAHRVLGLPVPSNLDSNPAIQRVITYTTPVPGMPLSLVMPAAVASPTISTTLPDAPVPSLRKSRAGLYIALVAVLLGIGGALAYVQATANGGDSQGTSEAVVDVRDHRGSAAVAADGSNAGDLDRGSSTRTDATGSAASIGSAGSEDRAGSSAAIIGAASAGSGSGSAVVSGGSNGTSGRGSGTLTVVRSGGRLGGKPGGKPGDKPGGRPSTAGSAEPRGSGAGSAVKPPIRPTPKCDPFDSIRRC
ncbi:MAG: Serine/threonine-protein kinase pkn3 [Myxococcales bacterium]|nr:Serine/threonine-protein kinase pkn3 [Myxococcales bacterium]